MFNVCWSKKVIFALMYLLNCCVNNWFQVIPYMVYNELPTSKFCLLTFLPRQPTFAGNVPCEVLLGSSGGHEASTVWDQRAHVHVRTEKNIANSFLLLFLFYLIINTLFDFIISHPLFFIFLSFINPYRNRSSILNQRITFYYIIYNHNNNCEAKNTKPLIFLM